VWGNVTVKTPDLYGGAAVTTKNIYRKVGTSQFTEIAGAGTFTCNPGDQIEIVFGIGDATDEDDDQPFGSAMTWTCPCESYPTLQSEVVDDEVEGSLTWRIWDPEDGTTISATAPIDIDNGDVFNLKTEVQATFEEDFGNRFCNKGNALAIQYYTGNFTNMYATDLSGNQYASATCPTLFSASAGYTSKCFEIPTLKSNQLLTFYIVADASGSGKEPSGLYNVTVNLYDVNRYIDNDVTPPQVKCGWEDEDGNDIGSTGAGSATIYLDA